MSSLQTKKSAIESYGATELEELKNRICCMPDVDKAMTWAEINGVRRITKIVFTSALLDADESANIVLNRDFTYQLVDPFDLIDVKDDLVVT